MIGPSRDDLGRLVRDEWIAWAREQPRPKASWLVPWGGLSEPDKEVDRRIGERLYGAGLAAPATDNGRQAVWDAIHEWTAACNAAQSVSDRRVLRAKLAIDGSIAQIGRSPRKSAASEAPSAPPLCALEMAEREADRLRHEAELCRSVGNIKLAEAYGLAREAFAEVATQLRSNRG